MSKNTDERSTPYDLFNPLNEEFHFSLDVCATHENAKCLRYFTKEISGLEQSWRNHICFMNPPYSDIESWLRKAERESRLNSATIVCILPCDTSTGWFHNWIWNRGFHEPYGRVELRFPKGRFSFGKYKTSPMFATIIAIFRPTI